MSTVYAKRGADDKSARREAKFAMQRKQLQLFDEDGKLKKLEKNLQTQKQEIAAVKRQMEKLQIDLLGLERKQSALEVERTNLDHQITSQRAHMRRLEHEMEELRQAAHRGGRDLGV